jgi:hypothetical protein
MKRFQKTIGVTAALLLMQIGFAAAQGVAPQPGKTAEPEVNPAAESNSTPSHAPLDTTGAGNRTPNAIPAQPTSPYSPPGTDIHANPNAPSPAPSTTGQGLRPAPRGGQTPETANDQER